MTRSVLYVHFVELGADVRWVLRWPIKGRENLYDGSITSLRFVVLSGGLN